VPEALDGVEEAELGTGVRTFPSADEASAIAPRAQVNEVGQLGHPGTCPGATVRLDRRDPVLLLDEQEGISDPAVDGHADRDLEVALGAGVDEVVGGPG
jgi:hypothetical protein